MQKVKLLIMGSWNTDGGVSRHTTPVAEWLIKHGYEVKVFTHYKESTHGFPLNIEDESFVHRSFTVTGKEVPGKKIFDSELLLKAIEEEGYNIFLAEDLGMLPMNGLLEIFPRIKKHAKTILLNHDNVPKPDNNPFWKFDWDAILNFLPEQNIFMSHKYDNLIIYYLEFPVYPISSGNKDTLRSCLKSF